MPEKSLNYDLDLSNGDIWRDLWNGFFPAQYNFKTDAVGSTPAGWTAVTGTSSVVASLAGHANVYQITNVTALSTFNITGLNQTSGTIEFWARPGQTNMLIKIVLYNGATEAISIRFNGDGNIYAFNDAVNTLLMAYAANTWYHFRIIFDCATDIFSIYINDVLEADAFVFYAVIDSVTKISLCGSGVQALNYAIDAVDFSWSPGYFTNRNYPPLLKYILDNLP